MDGVLIIDKPAGPTSHDIVAFARRVLREKRIGHTGTLDPMATGVLPLVLGRATRLASLLSSSEKEYVAEVRLGAATDTYDATGQAGPPPAAPALTRAQIDAVVDSFRGSFDQMPPPYSAKKVAGVPAYELARKNRPTNLTAVPVTVHRLDIVDYAEGLLRLRVRASPGFYVRTLAHDIGMRLGCGAHLEALRRTHAGTFGLQEAVSLPELDARPATAGERLIPLERLLPELPAVRLTEDGTRRAAHGNFLSPRDFARSGRGPDLAAGEYPTGPGPLRVRLFDGSGALLGIAIQGADGVLRPSIVLV